MLLSMLHPLALAHSASRSQTELVAAQKGTAVSHANRQLTAVHKIRGEVGNWQLKRVRGDAETTLGRIPLFCSSSRLQSLQLAAEPV